jgi:hypothetical protein
MSVKKYHEEIEGELDKEDVKKVKQILRNHLIKVRSAEAEVKAITRALTKKIKQAAKEAEGLRKEYTLLLTKEQDDILNSVEDEDDKEMIMIDGGMERRQNSRFGRYGR